MSNLLTAEIEEILKPQTGLNIILTVGNSLRSDDGVGPYIASQIESNDKMIVVDAAYNPENVIDKVVELKPSYIIIIDAADFKGKAGEARLIDKEHIPETTLSTHTIPLKVVARILSDDTSASIKFIGIQPKTVAMGEAISDDVKKTAQVIIDRIKDRFRSRRRVRNGNGINY